MQPSALHWAASQSYSGETIRRLIAKGANVRTKNAAGDTPLIVAAKNPYLDPSGLQALINAGSDIRERNNNHIDAMLSAVSSNNTDPSLLCLKRQQLETLKRAGADINENEGYTPLMMALRSRNLGVAKLVHGLGGDINARAKADGSTALHVVALAADDNIKTVKWLRSRGIELGAKDGKGETALQLFEDNLKSGRCHTHDPSAPSVNLCKEGTEAIIKLLEEKRRQRR